MSTGTLTPPPAARMTADEFGRRYSGARAEFVDGVVREIPMAGGMHGIVANWAGYYLTQHAVATKAGRVFATDTFVSVPTRADPERVYGADVCFVSYGRLPREAVVPAGVIPVCPDLVVEVRSPSDSWAHVFRKVGDYLEAGVPAVLVLDPDTRTASAYRSDTTNPQHIFGPADALVLPDVLPGLSVPVAALFA